MRGATAHPPHQTTEHAPIRGLLRRLFSPSDANPRNTTVVEALNGSVHFVVAVRNSIEEDFQRVTAPLANTPY